ncbi:DUF1592 domain-containing protein [Novipirellula maiorica]|uniref:DUF1592 domain-containing protein n=1 Tax=Novipirellula maiorica TaxID=1265734 RepID=UPI001F1D2F3A|nr:DUF1592 domain-containing protein [Rhodopirellula maiorica]
MSRIPFPVHRTPLARHAVKLNVHHLIALVASIILLFPAIRLDADDFSTIEPMIRQHCVRCHNADEQEGNVQLDPLSSADAELLTKVYEQIVGGLMPPEDEPQPSAAQRSTLAKQVLELAKQSPTENVGGLRRLNKREYQNTVRDLLGLNDGNFDPSSYIYDDNVNEGFDTNASSLVMSDESLFEYMEAAQAALWQALFTMDAKQPESKVFEVPMRQLTGASRRYENQGKDFYTFRIGGNSKIVDGKATRNCQIPGRYRITVTASAVDENRYPVKFVPKNEPPKLAIGVVSARRTGVNALGKTIETFPLIYDKEQTFTVETWIDRDFYPYLRMANGTSKPIVQIRAALRRTKFKNSDFAGPFRGPGIRVTQYKIEGPFYEQWPTESMKTTLLSDKMPDLRSAKAREYLLGRFAIRAFRRRVTREEIGLWFNYLNNQYKQSRDWNDAVVKTMTAMMASTDFLYLFEEQGELSDFPLASRLSYFFWSTMPDQELFSAANSGKLTEPATLRAQVLRLMQDPRADRFCESFVDQWLALDELGTMPPDNKTREFRIYGESMEQAMLEETRLCFRHVYQENRSVADFIDSDYSFINNKLAELYGLPKQSDGKLKLTKLPASSKRGGLLTQGSVLTLTSNGVETSPVVRGVWVLDHFLGTPPPPPPEEVAAIVPDLTGATTVRQMLEKHRNDKACMQCHKRIDPLGFALEAYDPIGRYRTNYTKRQKVSTEGNFSGKGFRDINGLKKILAADLRPFARNLIIRIAEYAKGRPLVAADYPIVELIVRQTQKNNFQLKEIVYRIATSELMTRR